MLILSVLIMNVIPSSVEAQSNIPQVVVKDGFSVLVLPDSLIVFIAENYPGFRVPTKEDRTGEWATYPKKDAVPYACWGDFNGDGRIDVALILIGNDGWRTLAFHRITGNTWEWLRLEGFPGPHGAFNQRYPAQDFRLYTLKAGMKLKLGAWVIESSLYQFDSITFSILMDDPGKLWRFTWGPKRNRYGVSTYHSDTDIGD